MPDLMNFPLRTSYIIIFSGGFTLSKAQKITQQTKSFSLE